MTAAKTQVSQRERRLLWLALAALVVAVPTIVVPLLAPVEEVATDPETGLTEIRTVLGKVERQLMTNQALRGKVGNDKAHFLTPGAVSDLLTIIGQAGGQAGLELRSNSLGVRQKAKPLPEVTIQIDYKGRYPNLVKFVDKLEHLEVPVVIRNLRMTLKDENSGEISGTVKLTSYLLEKPKHIGQKKPEEGEKKA